MRYIYTFLLYLTIPFVLLRSLWRARKAPAYAGRWNERFGCFTAPAGKNILWVHAVSVGETLAAAPLIKKFKQQYPDALVVVTTTTPTGSERVRSIFSDNVFHVYMPYDLPDAWYRFFKRIQPQLVVIMETELWPNMLYACHKRRLPVLVANARLSEPSAKGYARIASLTKQMLQQVTLMAVQTQAEAERFIKLGLDSKKIRVTGSIKFDIEIPPDVRTKGQALRQQWNAKRPVWIAASTHAGEDEQVLQAFAIIKKSLPDAVLIIVPRHPERFPKVVALCRKQGYQIVLRSEQRSCDSNTEIFIGDTIGELLLFYAAADVAFVGGSLVTVGGHNLLEPAALGMPSVVGPYLFNFLEISRLLKDAGAVCEIQDAQQLAAQVLQLLSNEQLRQQAGERGRQVVEQHRGSLAQQFQLLQSLYQK